MWKILKFKLRSSNHWWINFNFIFYIVSFCLRKFQFNIKRWKLENFKFVRLQFWQIIWQFLYCQIGISSSLLSRYKAVSLVFEMQYTTKPKILHEILSVENDTSISRYILYMYIYVTVNHTRRIQRHRAIMGENLCHSSLGSNCSPSQVPVLSTNRQASSTR